MTVKLSIIFVENNTICNNLLTLHIAVMQTTDCKKSNNSILNNTNCHYDLSKLQGKCTE